MRQFKIERGVMSDIIDKLRITPGPWKWDGDVWDYDDVEEAPWLITKDAPIITGQVDCNYSNARLIAASPDLLKALADIIKIQNDPRESLTHLNGSIRNAENMLIDKFPEIKELLCPDNSK